jgi:PAS domain S-box-containing protein
VSGTDDLPIQELLDSAPDSFIVVDETGSIVFANKAVQQVFGYRPDELIGQTLDMLIPERLRKAHLKHRLAFQEDPKVRPMGLGLDLLGLKKDGTEFPVEISLSPLARGDEVLFTAIVRDVTERLRLQEDRQALELELETERERHRIAMDLHDGTIQDIYGAALTLELAQAQVEDERFADSDYVERAADQLRGVVVGIRNYIFDLRPRQFEGDLSRSLLDLASEFHENSQIETTTDIDVHVPIDPITALTVYNIAHESLSNIHRHAQARKVHVELHRRDGVASLAISDDGVGFDPAANRSAGHRGLHNIALRAQTIQGTLKIESTPGLGTQLKLDFPIDPH